MTYSVKFAVNKAAQNTPSSYHMDYGTFANLQELAGNPDLHLDACSWFACALTLHFPEVAAKIDEDDYGVTHLEMARLTEASRDAIISRDWSLLASHFAFVSAISEQADVELQHAIDVSYLGNLLYDQASINYAKARTMLPRTLLYRLEALERHYSEINQYNATH